MRSLSRPGSFLAIYVLKLRDGFEDRAEGDYGVAVISEEQARAGLAAAREFLDQINRRLRGRESGET